MLAIFACVIKKKKIF